ncbi:MAG TPA: FecR family protein, partial [Bryobacteraceae bacterium]|nr:FecR family protein [Bryobacteraceae bacterium]
MHSKLLSWLSLLGLFAVFSLTAAAQQAPGKIIAARVSGDVTMTVKATQVSSKVAALQLIQEGSIVTTAKGASVVLLFDNGASINLGTDSSLDIQQFTHDPITDPNFVAAKAVDEPSVSHTKLHLSHGELVGKVAHLKKDQGSDYTVTTPVGAAGIRGTTFQIVYTPNGTGQAFFSLTTAEGSVEYASGTVNGQVPPPVTVNNSNQVSLTVTITVNDQTGAISVTLPGTTTAVTIPVTVAPNATTAQIQQSAAQIAQAVANVVIPTGSTNGGGGGQGGGGDQGGNGQGGNGQGGGQDNGTGSGTQTQQLQQTS